MGIRQTVNDNPVASVTLTAIVMLGTFFGVYVMFFRHPNAHTHIKCYFCDEDGKNVFIDDAENVPPFDHNGKLAYRAVIFKCVDPQGKVIQEPFVQRVECYDEESRAEILKQIRNGIPAMAAEHQFDSPTPFGLSGPGVDTPPPPPQLDSAAQARVQSEVRRVGLMIKRPTDTKWVKITDGKAWTDIFGEQCAGGTLRPVGIAEKALGAQ